MSQNKKIFYMLTEDISEAKELTTKRTLDVYPSKAALISVMASIIPANLSTGPIIKVSGEDIIAPEAPEGWTGTIHITGIKPGDAEIIAYDSPEFDDIKKEVLAVLKNSHPEASFA